MLLEMHQIRKVYRTSARTVVAVSDISLSVNEGEFVAVQGPSGCGKTTLLLVAGALLVPDAGSVTLDGENPYALSNEQRARFRAEKVGFVFQQFHLVPYLTVLENVLAASLATRPSEELLDRARELIHRFGLDDRQDHVPGELSTGERQRTALARALLNRPRLLLADEPTGNLDAENARVVLDDLAAFADEGGAVLLVTHDETAASRAGRRIKLQAGEIVSDDQPASAAAAG